MKKVSSQIGTSEQGQSLVLLALALVGILALAGIAVDVGFIYARRAQFSSAIDAAALAGVQEMPFGGIDASLDRVEQFLNANGWPVSETTAMTATKTTNWLGVPSLTVTVTWPVETFFLQLLNFESTPLQHTASASFYSSADLLTPTANQNNGKVRTASQFVFGPNSCSTSGDVVSSRYSAAGIVNQYHPRTQGAYIYRIQIPEIYTETADTIIVELFDPDIVNTKSSLPVSHTSGAGGIATASCGALNGNECVVETGEGNAAHRNPYWFVRVDENWGNCGNAPTGAHSYDASTTFSLYTLQESNGRQVKVDIGVPYEVTYLVHDTDLQWVNPWHQIDIFSLAKDEFGNRYIYLEVKTTNGISKNVWDLRAGPPLSNTVSSDVNLRNVQFYDNPALAETGGVKVFAIGYMPLKSWVSSGQIDINLANVESRLAGGEIYASMFDVDRNATGSVKFYYDLLGETTGAQQFSPTCLSGGGCNNDWVKPFFDIPIPSIDTSTGLGDPFFGGALSAQYTPGGDEHVWNVNITDGTPFLTD